MMEKKIFYGPCLVWTTREDGTLISVNELLCRKTGYSSEELTGRKSDLIYTMATRIFQQTHLFPLLKMQEMAEEIFISLQNKEGEILPVLINAERQVQHNDVFISYAGIVVNQRQKFEQELIRARKTAENALRESSLLQAAQQDIRRHAEALDIQLQEAAQRNEELRQFNQVVTHNLQEPLRKSFLYIDRLKTEMPQAEKTASFQRLFKAVSQFDSVISGLQQYIWLSDSVITPETINLRLLLSDVQMEINKEIAGEDLLLQTEDLPEVWADHQQLHILFYQLFYNVYRFRKESTAARVIISGTTLFRNQFRKTAGKYKWTRFARIDLRDEGIGFDESYKDQALALFGRLHPQSGRGIGLALCKKIMENHGGSIDIRSEKNKGTTVRIFFPLQGLPDAREE